jgi:hypothetical protein
MKQRVVASLFALCLMVSVACAPKSTPPVTPAAPTAAGIQATPTATAIQAVAVLSSANLAAAQSTVALHKAGTISDADHRMLLSYYASVDAACYQARLILGSTQTPAEKYAALSALAVNIVVPQVATPEIQTQLAAIAASTTLLVQSIEGLHP